MTKRAKSHNLMLCRKCHKLSQQIERNQRYLCPRCDSEVYCRLPQSLSKSLAFVITAFILLIPANVYPVTNIQYLGSTSEDTIISGVIALINADMIAIGVLVFFASIFIPLMKLVGILFLIIVVKMDVRINKHQATIMYRIISVIGKWSMLDLFMISILVTLLDMGAIIDMQAGIGTTAFALVVIFTIYAANQFDVRLIWDLVDEPNAG